MLENTSLLLPIGSRRGVVTDGAVADADTDRRVGTARCVVGKSDELETVIEDLRRDDGYRFSVADEESLLEEF